MLHCKVEDTIISQQKENSLIGKRMLLCEVLNARPKQMIVAVDLVGASIGSEVIISKKYCNNDIIDSYIVALVDQK